MTIYRLLSQNPGNADHVTTNGAKIRCRRWAAARLWATESAARCGVEKNGGLLCIYGTKTETFIKKSIFIYSLSTASAPKRKCAKRGGLERRAGRAAHSSPVPSSFSILRILAPGQDSLRPWRGGGLALSKMHFDRRTRTLEWRSGGEMEMGKNKLTVGGEGERCEIKYERRGIGSQGVGNQNS